MMILSVVLIYQFTVNKMILKYQSGQHELTNDTRRCDLMGSRLEGEIQQI